MTTQNPDQEKAASKVIAKAVTWADRRKAAQVAPRGDRLREVGRYEQSGDELAEAVEKYKKGSDHT